jgi:hypothetical protein
VDPTTQSSCVSSREFCNAIEANLEIQVCHSKKMSLEYSRVASMAQSFGINLDDEDEAKISSRTKARQQISTTGPF